MNAAADHQVLASVAADHQVLANVAADHQALANVAADNQALADKRGVLHQAQEVLSVEARAEA